MQTYAYECIHMHVYTCMHTYACIQMQTSAEYLQYIILCIYANMCTCIHTRTYVCTDMRSPFTNHNAKVVASDVVAFEAHISLLYSHSLGFAARHLCQLPLHALDAASGAGAACRGGYLEAEVGGPAAK